MTFLQNIHHTTDTTYWVLGIVWICGLLTFSFLWSFCDIFLFPLMSVLLSLLLPELVSGLPAPATVPHPTERGKPVCIRVWTVVKVSAYSVWRKFLQLLLFLMFKKLLKWRSNLWLCCWPWTSLQRVVLQPGRHSSCMNISNVWRILLETQS